MTFHTNTSERMRILADGRIGVGVNDPSAYDAESDDLIVASGVDGSVPTPGITIACLGNTKSTGRGALRFSDGTSGTQSYIGGVEYNHNGDAMSFRTAGVQRLTIDSSGDANFIRNIYSQSTLLTTNGATANYRWQTYNNSSDDAYVINSRNKGDVFKIGYTTGNIGINRDPHSDYKIYMMGDSTTSSKYIFVTLNSGGYGVLHARNDGAVYAGLIATDSGTDLVLNSSGFICKKSSSIRYKKDVENIDIGLDFILSLNPVKYNLKSNDQKQIGFIAEDFPDERFVSYSQVDTKDESKGIQKEAVNYSQLTAVLTKAIQEQQTIIEDLKSRIQTLEG